MNGNTRTQGRRGGTIKRGQMYMGKTRKKKIKIIIEMKVNMKEVQS